MDARLRLATISFHTNDEDKDSDTYVTVTITDSDGVVAAQINNNWERFPDGSDKGPYALIIYNESARRSLLRGRITIRIDPIHGRRHDTWRFNWFLRLEFDDGPPMNGHVNGNELSQDDREKTWPLQGIVH